MPNWCSGNIRFRGKMDDILKLLREECMYYTTTNENDDLIEAPVFVKVDNDFNRITISFPEGKHNLCYIRNTDRNILHTNFDNEIDSVSCSDLEEADNRIIVVFNDFSAAWSIEPESYVEISKKYNVDIRILGWEQGVGFDQEIEIVGGNIIRNQVTEYKDYADYLWRSALPYIGG